MEPQQQFGKFLIFLGIVLVGVGAILLLNRGFGPLGKLPGDIRIDRPNFRFYFPLTTCLILSLLISAILYVLTKLR